jgi:putative hemolysin
MSVDICNRDTLVEALPPARKAEQIESDVFGRIGNLETRLARTPGEIDAAQSVRYLVFVVEM